MDNAGALPTYPQRSSNQRDQINRTIDESRLSANNPIASGTGPGGDIMSESRGEIISVRRGDFIGIRILPPGEQLASFRHFATSPQGCFR